MYLASIWKALYLRELCAPSVGSEALVPYRRFQGRRKQRN